LSHFRTIVNQYASFVDVVNKKPKVAVVWMGWQKSEWQIQIYR